MQGTGKGKRKKRKGGSLYYKLYRMWEQEIKMRMKVKKGSEYCKSYRVQGIGKEGNTEYK